MTSTDLPARSDTDLLGAGLALFVLPVAALAIKLAWGGWLLGIVLVVSPLLLIGYVTQAVVASTGFYGKRALFRSATRRPFGVGAAWLTSLGALLTAFFVVDGGDTSAGSAFMYVFGQAANDELGGISNAISFVCGIAWVGGWVWLLVEWILALSAYRKAAAAAA